MQDAFGRSGKRPKIASLRAMAGGLLIVNADDLGLSPADTDAILECFGAGAITSATAMVWMKDSERAAALAREAALPVGLHLNLIEPFSAPGVPADVAGTQRRVIERLRSKRPGVYLYHRAWRGDFERCIADQLARFIELYGRAPTHVDGHQHMHLVANALFSRALARVPRVRGPVARTASESAAVKRGLRSLLHQALRLRFHTTDICLSIRGLVPSLGGSDLEAKLGFSEGESVEVMVHPGWPDELEVLRSAAWREQIARCRLGAFDAL